ncbi:UNVERIFIED_CONTAM: hypothetical protein FKN15_060415 [Acipenser sinensis]
MQGLDWVFVPFSVVLLTEWTPYLTTIQRNFLKLSPVCAKGLACQFKALFSSSFPPAWL